MGSAVNTTLGSLECWEIVHIPANPPICPDLQPTGIYIFFLWNICNDDFPFFFCLLILAFAFDSYYIYAVEVLASAIEAKHANAIVRCAAFGLCCSYFDIILE